MKRLETSFPEFFQVLLNFLRRLNGTPHFRILGEKYPVIFNKNLYFNHKIPAKALDGISFFCYNWFLLGKAPAMETAFLLRRGKRKDFFF